jgi:hypothetical protein
VLGLIARSSNDDIFTAVALLFALAAGWATMIAFGIDYFTVELDESPLRTARADGYHVSFGNAADARLWSTVAFGERKLSLLTAPDSESRRPATHSKLPTRT